MNRLGLAAIGYTPDDKVPRPDEGDILNSFGWIWATANPQHVNMSACVCVCVSASISTLDYWSESDQDEVDGSMTLKQEGPSSLCDTYHRTPSVSTSIFSVVFQSDGIFYPHKPHSFLVLHSRLSAEY